MGINIEAFNMVNKAIRWVVFSFLCLTGIFFYAMTTLQAWPHPIAWVPALLLAVLILSIVIEVRDTNQDIFSKNKFREAAISMVFHALGALSTFVLSHELNFGAVVASAAVGLLGNLIFMEKEVEIYSGSFVGMCSLLVAQSYLVLGLSALLAGLLFYLSKSSLAGLGGKLGLISLAAVVIVGLMLGGNLPALSDTLPGFSFLLILMTAVSTPATIQLARFKGFGTVRASALVSLAAGLLLPVVFPENGRAFAAAVMSASFAGMSSRDRIPGMAWAALAGLLSGVVFEFSSGIFNGIGGKLGTIAFGASLIVFGLSTIFPVPARE